MPSTSKEYARLYREKNREKINAGKRKCYANNETHREHVKNKAKIWHENNRERSIERQKLINNRYVAAKRAAKNRNYDFYLSLEQYQQILLDGNCHYCGNVLNPHGSGLDRKNEEPFYDSTNSVACCRRCNGTFQNFYNYQEKLLLAEIIKEIDKLRLSNCCSEQLPSVLTKILH